MQIGKAEWWIDNAEITFGGVNGGIRHHHGDLIYHTALQTHAGKLTPSDRSEWNYTGGG